MRWKESFEIQFIFALAYSPISQNYCQENVPMICLEREREREREREIAQRCRK